MKKTFFFAGFLLGVVAFAKPVECSFDCWDGNPLCWKADSAKTGYRVRGGTKNRLIRRLGRMARVTVSARLVPEAAGTNDWSTLGVMVHDDDRNFWHVALVQAPPDDSGRPGRRFFELAEMRNGKWLSQHADSLRRTESNISGSWDYGRSYSLTLMVDPEGVRGEVRDETGRQLFAQRYAFPAPAVDGSVKAVTCGRPALCANGGFTGAFSNIDAEFSDPRPETGDGLAPTFPPYDSKSFVTGIVDKATGFFRVVQRGDGRWWVIDPLGRGMVLLGVDHVKYQGHWSQRTKRSDHLEVNKKKFPNRVDWEEDSLSRLKAWGFNLLGAGCDVKLQHRGLVHTIFLSMGDSLCRDAMPPEFHICPNEHRPCSAFPNVFHPDFPAWCDYVARTRCLPNRDDPWLFGYFIDNELAWWGRGARDTGLFNVVSELPDGHSAKVAQRDFLASRGVKGTPSPEVKLEFLRLAAERYFSIASAAIRRYDPNHLVLGARFAGINGAHPAVWEISGKYCDVVTFNCYPWADLDRNTVMMRRGQNQRRVADVFSEQYGIAKRPMLITEWSFPALDSGLPCTGGAGQRFRTQTLRTQATELFAKTMLSMPFLIGYDYFMWVDEPAEGISDAFPEDSNYGLINLKGDAYPGITSMFTHLHKDVLKWRMAGLPAERPATEGKSATAARAREVLRCGAGTVCRRDGDRYSLSNGAGLELEGRVGGANIFDTVKVDGVDVGRFTGMACCNLRGSPSWRNLDRIASADWKDGVLFVTGTVRAERGQIALSYGISAVPGRPWFFCELTKAANTGKVPVSIKSFYFRQYAPYAVDKDAMSGMKSVPNLWKAPSADVWLRGVDGAFFGGFTCASAVSMFQYFTSGNGKCQHPDAMFDPKKTLALAPGEAYSPEGTMWFLSLAGKSGGKEAWQKVLTEVESMAW